jgi:hypothetical protein
MRMRKSIESKSTWFVLRFKKSSLLFLLRFRSQTKNQTQNNKKYQKNHHSSKEKKEKHGKTIISVSFISLFGDLRF